jgi:hypothetical protein
VVVYLDVDNSVVHVFYYVSVSDIWSGERGGLTRGKTTVLINMCIYPLYQCGYNSYIPGFVFSKQTLQ